MQQSSMPPAPVIIAVAPEAGVVPQPPARPADHRLAFAVAGLVTAVAGLAGLLVPQDTVQLILLLVFAVAGPGAALMSVPRVGSRLVSCALSVAGSLTVFCAAAVVTLWTHLWQPIATIGVLIGLTVAVAGVQLLRLPPPTADRARTTSGRRSPVDAVPFVTLAAGVTLWIVSLVRLEPGEVDVYGLSSSLGVPFVVGVVLLTGGFAAELFGRARAWVLATVLVTVPVIMQATVPLLDGTTEYAWTYKHLGVVDLLRDNGHLLASNDIYQQWPGFFAVVAMLSHASGLDAISFAAWSSLFFALVNSLLTAALLRQFTRDRRVVALGVLLMQICMWVDIGYFSPQAFVYSLMLGFWIIVLRWLVRVPQTGVPARRLARLRAWALRGMPAARETDRRTRVCAALAATAVFAAITVSHQLSPFIMLVPVVAFALLGVLRPRLLALVLIAVLAAFVAPRLGSVSSQYNIFSLDLLSNAEGNADRWGTPEQAFSATVARTLAVGVWLAGLAVIAASRRRLGRVAVPALLAFLPMSTLIGGNYGGEAIYRVFAFSLPFVALLIGTVWVGRPDRRAKLATVASGLLLAVMMLAGLQGLQGQLSVHQVRATDIEAAEYFYAHAQPGAGVTLVAPNFPTKLAANYGSFNRGHVSVDISLVGDPLFTGSLSANRLPDIENYIRDMGYRVNYLIVSDAMADYTDYFGYEPKGTMAALDAAMRVSPDWTVFYQGPGVTIFQLTGDTPPAR
nr:hypothetical protein [uncultured Actinoplanes sp.]